MTGAVIAGVGSLPMSVIDVISGLPRSGRAHGEGGWMDPALGAIQEAGRTTGKEQRRAERLAAIRLRSNIKVTRRCRSSRGNGPAVWWGAARRSVSYVGRMWVQALQGCFP